MTRGNIIAIVLAVVIVAGAITGTVLYTRNKVPEADTTETETEVEVESMTKRSVYTVNLAYIQKMLSEKRFTDEFEDYTKDSFPTSTTASKGAYWKGVQQGIVVNPLLLAATSETLHSLGFSTPNVKPSELYMEVEGKGYLNEKGEETLESVRNVIFSDKTKVFTADLGNEAGQYYNSSSSNEDGIVYAQRVGITGNTACWIITTKTAEAGTTAINVDNVDDAYSDVLRARGNGSNEPTTTAVATEEKTVIQLCRCGNTATKNPPKATPTTTRPSTTTKKPETTTKKPETTTKKPEPTTKKPETTTKKPETTTKKPETTTKPATTKNPRQDPVYQGNAQRGGGKNDPTEKATSSYQPEKPTKATSVRTVTTTKPTTTKPTTTRPSTTTTTRPATTSRPTTTAPTMKPTEKPSSSYSDGTTTTIISRDNVFTGDPVLPD